MKNIKTKVLVYILLLIFTAGYCPDISNHSQDYNSDYLYNYVHHNRLVKNVYIILVDGLRYDSVLKNMQYVSYLIDSGRACLIKANFTGPSNSRPGYARIFTGSPTNINGIWHNDQESTCQVPSLFEICRKYGISTGASAYFWMGQLFNKRIQKDTISVNINDNIQYNYFYSSENEKDTVIFEMGMKIITRYKPCFFVIHPMEVDMAGHRFGALSQKYAQCIKNTDELIEEVMSEFDLKNSFVIILSDHGHRDNGGHGGNSQYEIEVPVIFAGNIVKGGVYNEIISLEDIGPTVCMLLGMPFSPYMTGSVIDFPLNIKNRYLMGKNNWLYKLKK